MEKVHENEKAQKKTILNCLPLKNIIFHSISPPFSHFPNFLPLLWCPPARFWLYLGGGTPTPGLSSKITTPRPENNYLLESTGTAHRIIELCSSFKVAAAISDGPLACTTLSTELLELLANIPATPWWAGVAKVFWDIGGTKWWWCWAWWWWKALVGNIIFPKTITLGD